jgi:hypothetical protein
LLTVFLLFCYHPLRYRTALLVLLCLDGLALSFFAVSDSMSADHYHAISGLACAFLAAAWALAAGRMMKRLPPSQLALVRIQRLTRGDDIPFGPNSLDARTCSLEVNSLSFGLSSLGGVFCLG